MRILIVDDEHQVRDLLRIEMSLAGHDAEVAANGREALEVLRARPVDIILTDIVMPELEGLETITQAKKDHPDLRVIAMSGSDQKLSEFYLKCADSFGADQVIQKPFEIESLLALIEKMTAGSEREDCSAE